MKTRFFLLLPLFCANFALAIAQQITMEGVQAINKIGSFLHEGELLGYYCFYEAKKPSSGKRLYRLKLFDQDLNSTGWTNLIDSKNSAFHSATATSKSLMLLFANAKKNTYILRQYSRKGEEISTKTIQERKDARVDHSIVAISDKGFLHYSAVPYYYALQFITEDESVNNWEVNKNVGKPFVLEYLASNDSAIICLLSIRQNGVTGGSELKLIAHSLHTGEELFKVDVADSQYAVQLTNGFLSGNQIHLFGQYFEKNAAADKGNSLGLCMIRLDMQGNVLSRQYLSWEKEVSMLLPANDKGKIKNVGYLCFHNFIKSQDGKVFGVAESYRRTADGWGIAATLLSPGSSNVVKIVVGNLYVFEFSSEFTLKSVQIFEKMPTDIASPAAGFESQGAVANYVRLMGGFDYAFTKVNKDRSFFSINYIDFVGRKSYELGVIQYNGNGVAVTKKDWTTSSFFTGILPAKEGYMALWEYDYIRKKIIRISLQKLEE